MPTEATASHGSADAGDPWVDLPRGANLVAVTQRVATAMKAAYACDGVNTRQHNEPAGGQDVWHFHQHVFPRWANDRLYERHQERTPATRNAIARHAASLRERLT